MGALSFETFSKIIGSLDWQTRTGSIVHFKELMTDPSLPHDERQMSGTGISFCFIIFTFIPSETVVRKSEM